MRTPPLLFAIQLSMKLLLVAVLLGAVAGALCMAFGPDWNITMGDQDLGGATGVALAAVAGGIVALVLACVALLLVTLFCVILPAVAVGVVLVLLIGIVAVVLSALGGLAAVSAPLLLVGLGCVLLFRAVTGRGPRRVQREPQPF